MILSFFCFILYLHLSDNDFYSIWSKQSAPKYALWPKKRKPTPVARPEKPLPLNIPKNYKPKNENIRPYLHDMIDDIKKSGEWKIHLTMKMKFMSSKDGDENPLMYSKRDNRKIMISFAT